MQNPRIGKFPALATAWLLAIALLHAALPASAKTPAGWNFIEYNEAIQVAKQQGKPVFVYFGFATCPYCEFANRNTFSSEELRKLYSEHYVLAYFDIRGNPEDMMTLHDGSKKSRAESIKHLKGSPVPGWMFIDSRDGREILQRKGSRTKVEAFKQFDAYVAGGAYKTATYEQFLASRGWVEEKVE